MKLTSAIESATLTHLLPELADKAQPNLTFWGWPHITVEGFEGSAPLDALAAKVMKLVKIQRFEYTPEERASGKEIARNITHSYSQFNKEAFSKNYFTFVIGIVRYFFSRIFDSRPFREPFTRVQAQWESHESFNNMGMRGYGPQYSKVFTYYTEAQYKQSLGEASFDTARSQQSGYHSYDTSKRLWQEPADNPSTGENPPDWFTAMLAQTHTENPWILILHPSGMVDTKESGLATQFIQNGSSKSNTSFEHIEEALMECQSDVGANLEIENTST